MILKIIKQVTNATRYSIDGVRYMFDSEFAARIEIYGFLGVLILMVILSVPGQFFVSAVILFLILLAMEAINTAIEVIIDRVSPEISNTGKRAKDLGSFAVMCLVFANAAHLIFALSQAELTLLKNLI